MTVIGMNVELLLNHFSHLPQTKKEHPYSKFLRIPGQELVAQLMLQAIFFNQFLEAQPTCHTANGHCLCAPNT